jgi:hypothetical protein
VNNTFSLRPLVANGSGQLANMTTAATFSVHAFDGISERIEYNLLGSAGGYFIVDEIEIDIGDGVTRVAVTVSARSSTNDREPWVRSSLAGNDLRTWRLDIGMGAGGTDKLDRSLPFTVVGSAVVLLRQDESLILTTDLAADGSDSTSLSGIASVTHTGDIAGVDMSTLAVYWDIEEFTGDAEVALVLLEADPGVYTPETDVLVTGTIVNSGTDPSVPNSRLDFYLSLDATITTDDIYVSSAIGLPSFDPATPFRFQTPLTLPSGVTGTYYLGGILNYLDADQTNQAKASLLPIEISSSPDILVRPSRLSFEEAPEVSADLAEAHQAARQQALLARAAATRQRFPSLIERAKTQGPVRVIVGLDMPFDTAATANADTLDAQNAMILSMGNELLSQLQGFDIVQHRRFEFLPYLALTVDSGALQAIADSPYVVSIEEDVADRPHMLSSNNIVGSPLAWAEGMRGSGYTVAVLDTGVDKSHPWFTSVGGEVVSEACYGSTFGDSTTLCPGAVESSEVAGSAVNCDVNTISFCDHGTHVAGSAAGDLGIGPEGSGVAPFADIIAIQVFSRIDNEVACGDDGSPCVRSWVSDQVAALERVYALRDTYNIAAVNMSLGGGKYTDQADCDDNNPSRKDAIDNLRAVGIATVISAGNDGYTDGISGPSCISSAISVGATTDNDYVALFSNISPLVDLLAPGSAITSAVPGGSTAPKQGTSMSAPHVSGAWAVLKQAAPGASVATILSSLQTTATLVDDLRAGGVETSMSRINVDLALGDSRTTFGVFNKGPVALNITSITPTSAAPWINLNPSGAFSVPPGGLQVVEVSINYGLVPPGVNETLFNIHSDDPDENPWPGGVTIFVTPPDLIFKDGFELPPGD